jgi:DNA-binding MarR family transcriptional regulator
MGLRHRRFNDLETKARRRAWVDDNGVHTLANLVVVYYQYIRQRIAATVASAMFPYSHMPRPSDDYLALVLNIDLRLLALADRLRQHWAAQAAALGLTTTQVKVLLRLTADEATPMRKLAQQLNYDASNLTTLVDRLAARGALERQADPTDRRVKALVLTPEGQRLRDQFWRDLISDAGPLAPLHEVDLRTLIRLLAKLDQPSGRW